MGGRPLYPSTCNVHPHVRASHGHISWVSSFFGPPKTVGFNRFQWYNGSNFGFGVSI
jgi:hypothetical protein